MRAVRGGAVIAAATVLLLFSMGIPWQPLFQVALTLYALAGLCLLWIANGLWGLRFERPSPVNRGQVGQTIHDAFQLANWAALPKLGLEVRDHSTLPGHHANSVLNIGPRRVEDGAVDTLSELRGLYTLGPTGAAASDPFGLFTLERPIGPGSELLIYPETVDLGNFSVPGTIITEGTRRRRRTQLQTLDPAGTRPYVYGDSQRRIHWLSSAHAGQLMVKEFEFTPSADVWIFLDLDRSVQVGSGVHSTEEYAVTAAASAGAHYLANNRTVGLVASARNQEVVLAERGSRQKIRLLETLALVKANGRTPLREVLWAERPRLHRAATAIVISSSVDEHWAGILAQMQHAGTRTAAILIEASTFGPAPAATMQVASLTSAGVPTYLIKRSATMREAVQEGLLLGDGGIG
ncbi:MAG TPA: DUF58 domain-containing protein [Chloroflexota bacterium]|nr:DUF58 domain-containing protein [Chloroflexota bacterium]